MRRTGRKWGVVACVAAAVCAALIGVAAPPGSAQEPPPAETTSETFQVGPIDLAAHGQPGDQVNQLFADVPRPEGDIAVRGIDWRFVDENGNDVSSHMAHLHHMVLLDSGRRDQLCSFPSASRFAATGKELTDLTLPDGYAYHSPAGAPWQGVYHVMNMSDEPMRVAIEYTVTYAEPGDLLDVEPYFLDVTGCWGTSEYPVPGDGGPGSVHERSRTYTMTREGYILVGGGHLHDGGIDVTLAGPGGEVCRSTAVYEGMEGMEHLVEITPCPFIDEPFAPGDEFTLTSRYQNDEPIPGAMGIMLSYMHHTDPPPPEPEVDIELGSLGRDGLRAELSCVNAPEVVVSAYVTQQKGGTPPVTGGGDVVVPCADGPVVVPMNGGPGGALAGGEATVDLYAWADDGRVYAEDSDWGTVRVPGRIDLTPAPPPTVGLPITIDPQTVATDGGQAVTGTVTCDSPRQMWISVSGSQRAGRHAVRLGGGGTVACDGTTAFSVPVSSFEGRLATGPAAVTVDAYDGVTFEVSAASATVRLRAERPEPPTATPAPPSQLTLVGAERTVGGVAVTVSVADCPVGALVSVDAAVAPVQGRGRRVAPPEQWVWSQAACDGGDATVTLPAVDVQGSSVFVDAYGYVELDGTWVYVQTWGELPVTNP